MKRCDIFGHRTLLWHYGEDGEIYDYCDRCNQDILRDGGDK